MRDQISLKYLSFKPSGCQDIGIRKLKFEHYSSTFHHIFDEIIGFKGTIGNPTKPSFSGESLVIRQRQFL